MAPRPSTSAGSPSSHRRNAAKRARRESTAVEKPSLDIEPITGQEMDASQDIGTPPPGSIYYKSIGIWDTGFLTPLDFTYLGQALERAHESQLNPRDMVITCRVLTSATDCWDLTKLLTRTFEGNTSPEKHELEENRHTLYYRATSASSGCLAKDMNTITRSVKNRSFAWSAPLVSVWPPPLSLDATANSAVVWDFELENKDDEDAALSLLNNRLCTQFQGAFFALVR
jgi:hypothetical protein